MFSHRALSAVVIVSSTALFVYLGGIPFVLFLALISGVAAREFCRMFRQAGFTPVAPITIIITLAFLLNAYLSLGLVAPIILLGVFIPLVWQVFAGQTPWYATVSWIVSAAGSAYIGLPMSHFVLLRNMSVGQDLAGLPAGVWWVTLAILGTWASDTGAYITGMLTGRHSFMAHISPKKTWEGAIGGVVWPMVVGVVMGVAILGFGWLHGLIIGALIGCVAIVGDLGESLIKRGTGVKDTGKVLPGHGGMLDRIDSLIFTGPLVYYYLLWVVGTS